MSLILIQCSRFEESEREKMRQQNRKKEAIFRESRDNFYALATPTHTPRSSYPWEAHIHLPKITKEFFRCKGSRTHSSLSIGEGEVPLSDCDGCTSHGLPVIHGKEGVYPLLVDLLNYIQNKTGRRVVVTCGHRCPTHNTYSDPSKENRTSKHQIGAEVDFYVQGMEERPLEIVGLAMQFFQETPPYAQHFENYSFKLYERGDSHTRIKPWMNKELFIKIFSADEGRDGDNRHPYPYISFQVRFDRETKEPVVYNWEKAHRGYPRS
ncbi:MAG TPA: hypothetical protein VJK48_03655 [Chlamydiales bacterium]|nr:hypothetical protein [Chlamydiales bacterium]